MYIRYTLLPVYNGVHVAQSLVFCVIFCRTLFVLFLPLYYLRLMASDYPFGIFNFSYFKIMLFLNKTASVVYGIACSPRLWQIVCQSLGRIKPRTIELVFVAFPLITQLLGVRAKTVQLGIMIMCQSAVTCLNADYCFNELALY